MGGAVWVEGRVSAAEMNAPMISGRVLMWTLASDAAELLRVVPRKRERKGCR
jgi:hypothetical protein